MKSICLTASEITQILKCEKTQCRKVIKNIRPDTIYKNECNILKTHIESVGSTLITRNVGYYPCRVDINSPYKIGEIIYCKEPWMIKPAPIISKQGDLACYDFKVFYKDGSFIVPDDIDFSEADRWYSTIFMSEKYTRCKIMITDIRAERLLDISEEDAIAEGITQGGCLNCGNPQPCGCGKPEPCYADSFFYEWAKKYSKPFNKIYNEGFYQWVWVYTFEKV